jgi:hypothetical protein
MAIAVSDVRFWGFGAHILILLEFSHFLVSYPLSPPPGRSCLISVPIEARMLFRERTRDQA